MHRQPFERHLGSDRLRRLAARLPHAGHFNGTPLTAGRARWVFSKTVTCHGVRMPQEILQGASGDHLAAANARTRPQVQDPIGTAHGVFIVFHHHERIASGSQFFQGV